MPTKKNLTELAGICVAVLCVGALSAADFMPHVTSDSDEPPLEAVPIVLNPDQISLPIDAYLPTVEDIRTVQHGVYEAVTACMARFGFDYPAVQPTSSYQEVAMFPGEGSEYSYARLYGLFDAELAAQKGYHAGPTTEEGVESVRQQTEDETLRWQSLSDDFMNVLGAQNGGGTYSGHAIPEGGCLQAAESQIRGPQIELLRSYEDIMAKSWTAASGDSRVQSVFAAWGECMLQSGYSYDSPWAANDDRRWGTVTVSQLEIDTAVADVHCKQQTNLVGVYSTVQGAYQQQLMSERSGELQAGVKAFVGTVEKARAVLSENR